MALTATVDVTATPITLTIKSDKRKVEVSVTSAGETATGTALFPIKITDASRTWTLKSDDGSTAVYTG
jgi:hypothetical protein